MITHNGKQVSIAMRNRKAINLIARNGKAMWDIGGGTGIRGAAAAVILAEYGKQVWSDVKQYAKAHPAIVPFINQDPHLACSISTNSNKRRYLESSGGAYIKTDIVASDQLITEASFAYLVGGQYQSVFGAATSGEAQRYTIHSNATSTNVGFRVTGTSSINVATQPEEWNSVKISKEEIVCNGSVVGSLSASTSFTIAYKMALFAENQYDTYPEIRRANARMEFIRFSRSQEAWFIPHLTADGQCGMLDLVTYTFHPNANTQGQFTIAITDKE